MPVIPYIEIHPWVLIPKGFFAPEFPPLDLAMQPAGTLMAIGIVLATFLARSYARFRGLNPAATMSLIFWVLASGVIGGHLVEILLYQTERMLSDPAALLRIWDGQSSFGGFAGAITGAWLWGLRHQSPVLPYAEAIAFAFPTCWVFARMGCAVVHDHPGALSDAWFAVQYPGGARHDLGLYECVLLIPLALYFLWQRRRIHPWGYFSSRLCLLYVPPRFFLDFLRVGDVHYGGLTPAQWLSIAAFALGLYLLLKRSRPTVYEAPEVPKAFRA